MDLLALGVERALFRLVDGLDIDRSNADSPETVAAVVARAATGEDDRNDIPVRE